MGIHFSSDILAFALEKEKLTRTYYIAIFEADISIGDVFACPPFNLLFFQSNILVDEKDLICHLLVTIGVIGCP